MHHLPIDCQQQVTDIQIRTIDDAQYLEIALVRLLDTRAEMGARNQSSAMRCRRGDGRPIAFEGHNRLRKRNRVRKRMIWRGKTGSWRCPWFGTTSADSKGRVC